MSNDRFYFPFQFPCLIFPILVKTWLLDGAVPPSKVSIKLTPKQPVAGVQLEILCETGSSNPQSVITWWRDGFMLNGFQDGIIEGLYGGKATRNILKLNVTSQDDGSVITCQGKIYSFFP